MAKRSVTEVNPFCQCLGREHLVCKPWKVSTAKDTIRPPSDALLRGFTFKEKGSWTYSRLDDATRSALGAQHVAGILATLGESPTFRYTAPHVHTFGAWGAWTADRYSHGQRRLRSCECGHMDQEYESTEHVVAA